MQETRSHEIFYDEHYDLGELYRPVVESIQHPYLLINKKLLDKLEDILCWMVDNEHRLENHRFDMDQDYPGILILLVSRKGKASFYSIPFPNLNAEIHKRALFCTLIE